MYSTGPNYKTRGCNQYTELPLPPFNTLKPTVEKWYRGEGGGRELNHSVSWSLHPRSLNMTGLDPATTGHVTLGSPGKVPWGVSHAANRYLEVMPALDAR